LPPGLPGGGITFRSLVGGGLTVLSGSTPAGGQIIPFESESLSLKFGSALPTVGGFPFTSGGQAGITGSGTSAFCAKDGAVSPTERIKTMIVFIISALP